MKLLKPLPYPVYFVCEPATEEWNKLIHKNNSSSAEEIIDKLFKHFSEARACDGAFNWSVQTYIQLKQRGLDVHLVSQPLAGSICVAPYDHLSARGLPFNAYMVACQYDRGRPEICEQRIVQNKLNLIDSTDHFLPHWPQPNLYPRDPSRGSLIENLVYKGREQHLAKSFKNPEFLGQLQSLDINFSFKTNASSNLEQAWVDWNDYTTADVVLAVRDSTGYHLSFKPPSKLLNAWFAGCPALLGPEPAYQQLRESELDYIEVRSWEDAIAALRRLKDEPALYAAMAENGLRRAKDYTPDAIASRWRDVLAGPIASGYERWLHQSPVQKLLGRPVQFAFRLIQHNRTRRNFWANVAKQSKTFSDR